MKYNTISETRLKEAQVFFRDFPNLSPDEVILYANFAEIVDIFTNHKLDTRTIFEVYDFLSDVIHNKKPNIRFVPKEDRIRAQVGLMDTMPQTAKLNIEERTLFAFCVYWSECIDTFDEETNEVYSGLVDFTSVEKIRALYEETKAMKPVLFEDCNIEQVEVEGKGYGYSLKKPIKATSIDKSYDFLNRLAVKGATVTYTRVGSCSGKRNRIVDLYEITVTTNTPSGRKKQIYKLYIDPYSIINSKKAPKPFSLLS